MRRNRNGVRKERIIMLASSALVLTALTVTGVYVRSSHRNINENNVLDLSAIENAVDESAENNTAGEDMGTIFAEVGTDDLDYDPFFQEANSANVENEKKSGIKQEEDSEEETEEKPDSTSQSEKNEQDKQEKEQKTGENEGMFDESSETTTEKPEDTEAIATTVQPVLDFGEEDTLVWPIVGDILINYSMDKTIYFPTLQQYKYHPAIVIAATEGEAITAAAEGRVTSVSYDPKLGNTVVKEAM